MECKSCKHYRECLNEANKRGEIFDPEYDGEHGCGANSFEKISNGDRIRAMTDEELAYWMHGFVKKHFDDFGEEYTMDPEYVEDAIEWLQREADEINI